jgi:predicted nucleotidyltransferase
VGVGSELEFVRHAVHRRLLGEELAQARDDPEVTGLMLMGSVARGDALPGSDLDLFLLLADGCRREFQCETRDGIPVERKHADPSEAAARLERKPTEVYSYLGSRVLYDPTGRFAELVESARRRYQGYQTPVVEKQYLAHCLRSARGKLRAAQDAGDSLKAGCAVAMTTWFVVEALWAANDKPPPSGGTVLAQARNLNRQPPDLAVRLEEYFTGDLWIRVQAAAEIINWLLPLLEQSRMAAG